MLLCFLRAALKGHRHDLLSVPQKHVADPRHTDHDPRQVKYRRVDFRIARQ